MDATACAGAIMVVAEAWQASPCLQGLSALPPGSGALPCSPPEAAVCCIIGQSGGQGLHGVAAAREGAPAITSMTAAIRATMMDNLGSERPPTLKMTLCDRERKACGRRPGRLPRL